MRSQVGDGGGFIASYGSDTHQFNRDTYAYVWGKDGSIASYGTGRGRLSGGIQALLPVLR
jgi:hypothetical protein